MNEWYYLILIIIHRHYFYDPSGLFILGYYHWHRAAVHVPSHANLSEADLHDSDFLRPKWGRYSCAWDACWWNLIPASDRLRANTVNFAFISTTPSFSKGPGRGKQSLPPVYFLIQEKCIPHTLGTSLIYVFYLYCFITYIVCELQFSLKDF